LTISLVGPARLDIALVERGLAPTRSRARDLIVRGLVRVEGVATTKPAHMVGSETAILVAGDEAGLVSRGAVKLRAALAAFEFDPTGRVALDVGASTGGFTQMLIDGSARHVFAVDVGHGQLHPKLADDARVTSLEGTDSRSLTRDLVQLPLDAITADVSFISLRKALPAALTLAAPGCWLIALVKPQFEVGRAYVGKGGIVRDAAAQGRAVLEITEWVTSCGWRVVPTIPSPIVGGSGNTEFLLGATRND
jgi:23S rRNA (cytidine1920-2'-O)/16S rRNA (cytidine1409-2'-O)-methyltransferase